MGWHEAGAAQMTHNMKIILAGGTGQVGTLLARHFHEQHHDVVVLSRASKATPWKMVLWSGENLGDWVQEIDGADVVVNLAGRSVNCRYNAQNQRDILRSRVDSTRIIGEAIALSRRPPRAWLQMSTATIYAHRYDAPNDEDTGILGGNKHNTPDTWHFSIDVAKAWEQALNDAITPATRKVALRAAMVMSPDQGGVFDVLLRLVRFGLGGKAGDGRQYISWVHHRDFARAIDWLIDHDEINGAVNIAAPQPLPNAIFMRELREAWGARVGMPAKKWILEAGALLLRTETELILKSRRVVPGQLLASGFTFEHPEWPSAAVDLCSTWRSRSA